MSDETRDASLSRFEAQLASLAPQSRLDHDRLVFAAGRRSAEQRHRRVNRLLFCGNVGLAALVLALVAARPLAPKVGPPRGSEPTSVAHVPRDVARPTLASADPDAYFRLRQAWIDEQGIERIAAAESVPATSGEPPQDAPTRRPWNRWLRQPIETL